MVHGNRAARLAVVALVAAALLVGAAGRAQAQAIYPLTGCGANVVPPNDDDITGQVPLGFEVLLGGQFYSELRISNNGYVTFGPQATLWWQHHTWENFNIPFIAAFQADVDTRGAATSPMTYGPVIFDGRPALCINWINVGYYDTQDNRLNSFQMILVDRNNRGTGDFDVWLNYDTIDWESGATGVNGRGGPFAPRAGVYDGFTVLLELPGSNTIDAVYDGAPFAFKAGQRESGAAGRYKLELTGGVPPQTAIIAGTVADTNGNLVVGAPVSACSTCFGTETTCVQGSTGSNGRYNLTGLLHDDVANCTDWRVNVMPPAGGLMLPNHRDVAFSAPGEVIANVDVLLDFPAFVPDGASIVPSRGGGFGSIPTVYWAEPLTLTTQGCSSELGNPAPVATYSISQDGTVVRSGSMTETPPFSGTYVASVAPLTPLHGLVQVTMTLTCPDGQTGSSSFDLYIDPSGWVQDTHGTPLIGAQVTLLRSDTPLGPFTVVPDGSAIMSPKNRNNPDYTDGSGHFGWDTIPGFYIVRAEFPGCVAPGNPSQTYVDTDVLPVPPEWLDLHLYLDCESITPPVLSLPAAIDVAADTVTGARVSYAATAHDGRDGVLPVTCSIPSGEQFPLGVTVVECSATDSSGNVAQGSFPVRVTYGWSNVLAPLDPGGENRFPRGLPLPVRFRLRDASAPITTLVAHLYVARVIDGVPGPEQPARPFLFLPSRFVYERFTREYVFVWATHGMAKGQYRLRIDLGDGVLHTVAAQLR